MDFSKFKVLLEKEEELTIRNQFNSFMNGVITAEDKNNIDTYYKDFQGFVNKIDSNKVNEVVKSKFFHNVMGMKQNARERELRRLTYEISYFIEGLGHDRTYYNSPQVVMAEVLREVADTIEPRKNKTPKESMNEAWRRELITEIEQRFK
tara:strand:+ start:2004 stop:2453 length:450 start_codon:yes stop_codon:yes gene_type:complete